MAFQPLTNQPQNIGSSRTGNFTPLTQQQPITPVRSGGFQPLTTHSLITPKPQQPSLNLNQAINSGGLKVNNQPKNNLVNTLLQAKEKYIVNPLNNLPEAHFADKMPMYTPIGFAANLAQGLINTPAEAFKGAIDLGRQARQGTSTPQQVAGDLASAVQFPLLFLGGGVAKKTVEEAAAKTGAMDLVKSVGKEALTGGAFGVLGGLQSGKNITNTSDYLKNMLSNVEVGAATGGTLGAATHVVVPLAKGLADTMGAIFLKNGKKPTIDSIHLSPQVAQSTVINNDLEKTPVGKEMLKQSIVAQQTDQHVAITPNKDGQFSTPSGEKVDVSVAPKYSVEDVKQNKISQFENNIKEYRYNGGYSQGTKVEDASVRDIAKLANDPQIKEYTQEKVQQAIQSGEVKQNPDGTITLYRGGEPSGVNKLMSASFNKDIAQHFADNAKMPVTEIQVKPEDIKAFIGRDESEVLLNNPKTVTEEPQTTAETTRTFNAKGKETTNTPKTPKTGKPINNKETQVLQDIVKARFDNLQATAKTPEDYAKGVDAIVKDISLKAGNDKVVLSALRTRLNKEMYDFAGAGGGNFREAYDILQIIKKDDPEMGPIINKMEDHISSLDNKLLTAQKVETVAKPVEKVGKQTGEPTNQQPVGEGKLRDSAAFKRLVQHLEDKSPEDLAKLNPTELKYHQMSIADQAEKAMQFIEKSDPQKAYAVAKGYENPPEGVLTHAVNQALADRALAEKNYQLWRDLSTSGSLRLTRGGQEAAMERGRYNDNSPQAYMQQVLAERLNRLGRTPITSTIDMTKKTFGKVATSVKEKAIAKIDQATETLSKELKKKQVMISSAQNILDSLTCK